MSGRYFIASTSITTAVVPELGARTLCGDVYMCTSGLHPILSPSLLVACTITDFPYPFPPAYRGQRRHEEPGGKLEFEL